MADEKTGRPPFRGSGRRGTRSNAGDASGERISRTWTLTTIAKWDSNLRSGTVSADVELAVPHLESISARETYRMTDKLMAKSGWC